MKKMILAIMLSFVMTGTAFALPILSDLTGNSAHVETDTNDQAFYLTDTSGVQDDATAFLLFELAGNANYNSFGIVGSDGIGGLTHLEIFSASLAPITSATLSWDIGTDTVTNLSNSMSAIIDETLFGFYLDTKDDGLFYSIDELNVGGADLMASYFTGPSGHADLFGSNYILGFEDTLNGDLDYNDMVVGISDISALGGVTTFNTVPEPMPLALMGLGLIGMAGVKRKKKLTDFFGK